MLSDRFRLPNIKGLFSPLQLKSPLGPSIERKSIVISVRNTKAVYNEHGLCVSKVYRNRIYGLNRETRFGFEILGAKMFQKSRAISDC